MSNSETTIPGEPENGTDDADGTGTVDKSEIPLVEGAAAGLLAWIVGYVATYLVVAPGVRDSPLNQIIQALDGEPATYEMVGWVFYNAHFVNTVFRDIPIVGGHTTSYIGGEEGFTVILYVIPVVLLLLAGLAIGRYQGASDPTDGAIAGVTVLVGYLVLSIVGLFVFEISVGGASAAPDRLAGVALAGIVYPLVFAGAGGAASALLEGDRS
ncbi:hypothetical protein AArcSl_0236 [Halalkaliarchaeum desulfuricum]|uniref:DUF7978 domain-containing protein n=1 Tax=Halalkaliarchaeum desulfuricum TaxID=2055893 RepID=A0A343TFL9_9EURY|nr:transporter [Halalkaliarchaeum desulfuricum]AUX07891.1 hypothetical protein AArcSl_0236 [Halalkaliarchaeum desulfuricum]